MAVVGIAVVGVSFGAADVLQQITAVALARSGLFVFVFGGATLIVFNRLCEISMPKLCAALFPGSVSGCVAYLLGKIIHSSAIPTSDGSFIALVWIAIPTEVAAGATLLAVDKEIRCMLLNVLRRLRLGQRRTPGGAMVVRND